MRYTYACVQNMAADKNVVLICTFTCIICCVLCQLNLSEDSVCTASKDHNGTCVRLVKCGSAVLTYLYRNAGFDEDKQLPKLPEICSEKNNEPVVCCTDCVFSKQDEFIDSAIAPHGILVSRSGPVAWRKCLDFFQRLPYPCRGKGDVQLKRSWKEDEKCHKVTLEVSLAVGGQERQRWKFSHLALLGYGDAVDTAQWLCEGSVISDRFILTAAHCTRAGVFGNAAYVALGVQRQVDTEKDWKIYNIRRIIIHPEYNEPSWYNDIALLETETEIRFDDEILPACLDVGIHDVTVAKAAGMSSPGTRDAKEMELQMIYLNKLKGVECRNFYKHSNNLKHGYDHETQMCYGARNNTEDTCKRYSGSPLQIDQFHCQYTVVGVTSRAKECGRPEVPDIFTRVQHYVPWIERIVWPQEH